MADRGLLGSVTDGKAVVSLIFARIIYAINWLSLGAIFVLMSGDLGVGVGGLGTLTSAFYLGIGLMQVPGGLLSARWGPKRVVVIGVFMSSVATLLIAGSSTVLEISVLRFIVGTGMAFVFAPGVVLVARLFSGGKFGLGVGLFNSAFNFGGLFGLFAWLVIAAATGWRPSLLLGGGLGVLSGVLVMAFVPPDVGGEAPSADVKAIVKILVDRQLVLLGVATLGFGVANTLISGFMVEYLVRNLDFPPTYAGLVASLVVVVPVFTAIWGGRMYDRMKKPRLLMSLSLLGSALALFLAAAPNVYGALAASALGGIFSGIGYTFAFAGARDLNPTEEQYDGLSIAWVNSISLTGSFVPPLLYSYLVLEVGYSIAWAACGALTLSFLLPLAFVVESLRA